MCGYEWLCDHYIRYIVSGMPGYHTTDKYHVPRLGRGGVSFGPRPRFFFNIVLLNVSSTAIQYDNCSLPLAILELIIRSLY